MTQQLADLLKRGPVAQQARRQTVPEQVSSFPDRFDAGPLQRTPHDTGYHRRVRQRGVGRSSTKKNSPTRTLRAIMAQIAGDRLPDFRGQRQARPAGSLSGPDGDLRGRPIDVLEFKAERARRSAHW